MLPFLLVVSFTWHSTCWSFFDSRLLLCCRFLVVSFTWHSTCHFGLSLTVGYCCVAVAAAMRLIHIGVKRGFLTQNWSTLSSLADIYSSLRWGNAINYQQLAEVFLFL